VSTREFHLETDSKPFRLEAGQYSLLWRHESGDGYASLEELQAGDRFADRALMTESSGYLRELDLPTGSYRISFHGSINSLDVVFERVW
jgi:hypothetical protein